VVERDRITTSRSQSCARAFKLSPWEALPFFCPSSGRPGLILHPGGKSGSGNHLSYALMQIPAGYLSDRFSPNDCFASAFLDQLSWLDLWACRQLLQALVNQMLSGFFRALLFTRDGIIDRVVSSKPTRHCDRVVLDGGYSGSVIFNLVGPSWWQVRLAFFFISIASVELLQFCSSSDLVKTPPQRCERRKGNMLEALQLFRHK